ncbi:MAG TPA: NAD(P)H-hydrate dehydratase [Acidobacteriaceae bacterium]|jgi:NAD(P)H-hydrate epimerase|nr:NAD(P)H-hydrate dehydratase [Acidobacteriaceae bacterium]
MRVLTAAQMSEVDRRSVESGVAVRTLMENAGSAVARFCLRRYGGDGPVVVLCGKGNNGGDGAVAARLLAEIQTPVRLVLLASLEDARGDAASALSRAKATQGLEFVEAKDEAALRMALKDAKLIIDAVVGTGFKPPLRGFAAVARDLIAAMKAPVVAVDLPSGWDADATAQTSADESGKAQAFRANAVVTFVAPKLAHVFGHLTAPDVFGPVVVAQIGTPAGALEESGDLGWAGSAKKLTERPRDINGNKGKFGHVLIVGGSVGKAGAPAMASLAAMRTGAGLTTAAVPREILPTVAAVAPELMCMPLDAGPGPRAQGSGEAGLSLDELDEGGLERLLKGITVVGMGPGLGQSGTTPEFVRTFVERVSLPMVLDADALNAIAGRTELLKRAAAARDATGRARTIVLTPHPGEMARLVESSVKEVEADRVGLARRFATEHGVTLVLKGWRTLIAHPDGRVAVNTTGNPGMAKGGSGDILTGIVAAMLAQYPDDVANAVEAAVFLHGLAGDFATMDQEDHTVLATDTVRHLAQAFRARLTDEDGLTWIAGLAARGRSAANA